MTQSDESGVTINQYRSCGVRLTRDGDFAWEGPWRTGDGPTDNEQYEAIQKHRQGQKHVRWEFRTVTYGPTTTVEVTG